MKVARISGLAMLAALAIVAVVGGSSASATVLCSENAAVCPSGSVYATGTSIQAKLSSGTAAKFHIRNSYVECTGSTLSGKTTSKNGSPLPIEVTSLTFTGCSGACSTAEARNLPYSAGLQRTSSGNGTVTVKGGGTGNPGFKLGCNLGVTCIWGASEISSAFEGGNPAKLTANKAAITNEGSSSKMYCGESSDFSASYEITSPKPAYATAMASTDTVLCEENTSACPAAKVLPAGTLLKGEASSLTLDDNITAVCKGSQMNGETLASAGAPLGVTITSLVLQNCQGKTCTYLASWPVSGSLQATGAGNGSLTVPLQIKLQNCVGGIWWPCTYGAKEVVLDVKGGASPEVQFNKESLALEEGKGNCGETMKVTGNFAMSKPNPLWVTNGEL